MRDTILIVDDVKMNRKMIHNIFMNDFHILEAENGERAIEVLEEYNSSIAVILLDIVMPKMDGFEVIEIIKEKGYNTQIPIVLITGDGSERTEEKGYDKGVVDIILKPFNPKIVRRRVQNTIDLYDYKNYLENKIIGEITVLTEQKNRLLEEVRELKKKNENMVDSLTSFIEFRSVESQGHIRRMKKYTKLIASRVYEDYPEYNLKEDDVNLISRASVYHDLGMIDTPEDILLKPGKLTEEEYELIKGHSSFGSELIVRIEGDKDQKFINYCSEIARYHHERFDGRGYPEGLMGNRIPISAQIVSLVDVFDALISERCYKESYTIERALELIENGNCGTFNPRLIKIIRELSDELLRIAIEDQALEEEERIIVHNVASQEVQRQVAQELNAFFHETNNTKGV